jgi:hypothetical protein
LSAWSGAADRHAVTDTAASILGHRRCVSCGGGGAGPPVREIAQIHPSRSGVTRIRGTGDEFRVRRPERAPDGMEAAIKPFLKALSVLALGMTMAGCAATGTPPSTVASPYGPNVAPIDTTGNYGAR